MNVLGLAHDLWISSAALLMDGRIVAAICEERLNRQKKHRGFPGRSIDACLKMGGLALEDVDLIVCGWNPAWHMESLHGRYSSTSRWRPEYLYAVPNYLLQKAEKFPFGPVEERFGGFEAPIVYVDHQMAHAANAFYLSPFDEAAVFSADGRGERQTVLMGRAGGSGIEQLGEVLYPHSLGLFYGLITQYLGFVPHNDEWKVMALAAYGSGQKNRFHEPLRQLFELKPDGGFKMDLSMCGYHQADIFGPRFYTPDFEELIALPPRRPDEPLTAEHHQLAWALQAVYEEVMDAALTALHRRTGLDRLVLSGGCMMNSVYNGRVTSQTPFKEVFIPSCPDDSGISVGAALWGYFQRAENPVRVAHGHNYWGPSYDDEIEETLTKYKLAYKKLADPSRTGAEMVADGKLIGWFQGAMEFGQRALGNRSILADPRRPETKDLVNLAVKYRESFRPFAPAILAERAADWFRVEGDGRVPFMERVYLFREEVRDQVPAVVHADGSGRLQTVEQEENPRFYALIKNFEALTGVPIVLNTSFNLNGEPIVCSPSDAVRTFYSCGLDALILGDCLVEK